MSPMPETVSTQSGKINFKGRMKKMICGFLIEMSGMHAEERYEKCRDELQISVCWRGHIAGTCGYKLNEENRRGNSVQHEADWEKFRYCKKCVANWCRTSALCLLNIVFSWGRRGNN